MDKDAAFGLICKEVAGCRACRRMEGSERVLNGASGSLEAPIMFVGEAPGRLGADATGIPFHGDKAGHNFEALLEIAGISREAVFITNAALCNPKDAKGNNSTPNREELSNCSGFLRRQIELVDPKVVVTLGATALSAVNEIESHGRSLRRDVRSGCDWFGRLLIPLYHPGQRAMIHRSFANQQSDYKFVSDTARRVGLKSYARGGKVKHGVRALAEAILLRGREVSYFSLHKIAYLVEYEMVKKYGSRLTGAYFIRQKDGPYCTDLHIQKLKNSIDGLKVRNKEQKLYLSKPEMALFRTDLDNRAGVAMDREVSEMIESLSLLTDSELKTKAYMSAPMRDIVRRERIEKVGLYNQPIRF